MAVLDRHTEVRTSDVRERPRVAGKFLSVGDRKVYVRGVTYGTFAPNADGDQYPAPETVDHDFGLMASTGINSVRVYTVPPRWLLDLAQRHHLWVMVGLPWEQHVAFLDQRSQADNIEQRVRQGVKVCAGHPSVLCYAIGNEIPAPIARWYGTKRIERWLERLYRAVKDEDPAGLVTYVNFPSTEYLQLPFLDLVCFNVYLESQDTLEAYLARLQNLAGDRPLLMAEIGLDSRRNGQDTQAHVLDPQVRFTFAAGAAGIFVFAWTDEWYRGGYEIEDWDFGPCDRRRQPKPALQAVSTAFAQVPFPDDLAWPRISVVVCSYNGAATIADTCQGLNRLDYPDYEVLVVDDGSTDRTAEIARSHGHRVISTENRGLSAARNTGMENASGEIVAYIDDDACPDPHWLRYLAATFLRSHDVGVGGPNIAPSGDGWIAECVANAPGGPVQVLLTDRIAEHIPGCNMAFRRLALEAVSGCDPRYRAAGDDVDLCWRLGQRGWTIGFSPAAMVWHHRRNSIRAYWKQQQGYGKAEALLEEKWPERYNSLGHVAWSGRIYGNGLTMPLPLRKGRIYHGLWGSAPFQSIYQPAPGVVRSLPLMPEWYLAVGLLATFCAFSVLWHRLLWCLPLLVMAVAVLVLQAGISALSAEHADHAGSAMDRTRRVLLTAAFHLAQPLARLAGRIRHGLTPWRRRRLRALTWPIVRPVTVWTETWRSPERWPAAVEQGLRGAGATVLSGGDFDRWDLEVRYGHLGAARLLIAVEEHGAGRQLARFRIWPRASHSAALVTLLICLLGLGAALDGAWLAAVIFGLTGLLLIVRILYDAAAAMGAVRRCVTSEEALLR